MNFLCCTSLIVALFYEHCFINPQLSVDVKSSSWNFNYCNGNSAPRLSIWQKWTRQEIDEPMAPWEPISVNKLKHPRRTSVHLSLGNWSKVLGVEQLKYVLDWGLMFRFVLEIFRRKIEEKSNMNNIKNNIFQGIGAQFLYTYLFYSLFSLYLSLDSVRLQSSSFFLILTYFIISLKSEAKRS